MASDERDGIRRELPAPPPRRWREEDDDEPPPRRFRRDMTPHRSQLVFALGLIGFLLTFTVGLGFVTGLPAWLMGSADLKKMKNGEMDPTGMSQTKNGMHIGMAATACSIPMMLCLGSRLLMLWM